MWSSGAFKEALGVSEALWEVSGEYYGRTETFKGYNVYLRASQRRFWGCQGHIRGFQKGSRGGP